MITLYWVDGKSIEIYPEITIQPTGSLVIRVQLNRKDLSDYSIKILDPFDIPLIDKIIPEIKKGESWEVKFPLTNYLMKGRYKVIATNNAKLKFEIPFYLDSRKEPNQVFVTERKIIVTGLNKGVRSIKFDLPPVPDNFLLQAIGEVHVLGADYEDGTIFVDDLLGTTQKTITWKLQVQPTFLPLDIKQVNRFPDDFYAFHSINYDDEPGLEVSHPDLEKYDGRVSVTQPLEVIVDVLGHIHRNMRYVKQSKERGVNYALRYGRGDCTEYAAFFTTLLRKIGIKARLVSGMGRSLHNYWIPHAFVEVFIYGAWVPIDVVKPPKPYLQVGNRGELVAYSRQNWLENSTQDLQIQFEARKNVNPKIKYTQKLTESGNSKLPQRLRAKQPLKTRLKNIFGGARVKNRETSVKIDLKGLSASSILIVQGSLKFGKIIFMQYITGQQYTLDPDVIPNNVAVSLIVLDNFGKLILKQTVIRADSKLTLINNSEEF